MMTLSGRPVSIPLYRLAPQQWAVSEAASAVAGRACRDPGRAVIARVQPDNAASARVALRAGLRRATQPDTIGEDGTDHIYVSPEWCGQDS